MSTFRLLLLGASVFLASGQELIPADGVTPEWHIRSDMASLAATIRRLQPLMDSLRPDAWTANGAPPAYSQQLQSSRRSVAQIVLATDQLARKPERLTLALDVFFRLQHAEAILGSVRDAVRKYQDDAAANELETVLADLANAREKLRQHVADLAVDQEDMFQVVNHEAQRCRTSLTIEPVDSERRKIQRSGK